MVDYKICPRCKLKMGVRNGSQIINKRGEKKQYFICQNCGKQFPIKKETLNRTEKRLFSLLFNLIVYTGKENDTLKTIASICNNEVKSIGKLDLQMTKEKIELDKLENVCLAVCFNKKENKINIIKTYPEIESYTLSDLSKIYQKKFKELLDE